MDSEKPQVISVHAVDIRPYLEAEARALLDHASRLPLDHMDRWRLSLRYNEITRELRALEHAHIRLAKDG